MTRRLPPAIARAKFAADDFFLAASLRIARILDGVHVAIAVIAVTSLVAEYGYVLSEPWQTASHVVTLVVVWWFFLNNLLRFALARRRREHLRHHWFDFALMAVLLVGYAVTVPFTGIRGGEQTILYLLGRLDAPLTHLDRLYIAIMKLYVFIVVLASTAQYGHRLLQARFRPVNAVVVSFLFVIGVGTLLLRMPKATGEPGSLPWADAVFTSVSAVCVTGLTVMDTGTAFTWFGQSVLLALIQIGGLGYMTLASFFVLFVGASGSLRGQGYMRDLLDDATIVSARKSITKIVLFTLSIEAIGAAVLFLYLPSAPDVPLGRPHWFTALFHSVSAFCNAGFALWPGNLAHAQLAFSLPINLTIIALFVLGGLGFSVLSELTGVPVRLLRRRGRRPRLSIQTGMVLTMSSVLIVVGALGFLALEHDGALTGLEPGERVLGAFFQSATARTAGFNTLDVSVIRVPTAFLMMFLMVIGASPGGTGGGVKTTTFGLAIASAVATARGRSEIEIRRRRIPDETVGRALSILLFAAAVIFLSTLVLTLTDPNVPLIRMLFEETSAFGTVGLSMGITKSLSIPGRCVLLVSMFLGRVGPLTTAIALSQRRRAGKYDYPTEQVMVM